MNLPTYDAKNWREIFIQLNEDDVRWFPLSGGVMQVIFRCGEFPNVPLIGTLGCVNYNPTLALRQLRYPAMGPPAEESVLPLLANLTDKSMQHKISRAWKEVIYKGRELGRRSCGATDTYKKWVRSRVKVIKLPFQSLAPNPPQDADTVMEESDEVRIMKDQLARSEGEKNALETELKGAHLALEALKRECNEKSQSLEQENKRARIEKDSRGHISAANQDLKARIEKRNLALEENECLKVVLKEMRHQTTTLQTPMDKQAAQHEADLQFDEQTYTGIIKGYQKHQEERGTRRKLAVEGRDSEP